MEFNTYLFDFDGTLVDSMPSYISAMLRILDENNIPYKKDIIKIITPLGYAGTAKYYKELGVEKSEEELMGIMSEYALEKYKYSIKVKPFVAETLKALKEKGISLNVLTASPHSMLDVCLKRLGLYELFDNVWSCDDFNTTKADPGIYKAVSKRLNKNTEEILFLDDNLNAVTTAKKAGMKTCGVFDLSSSEYEEQIKKETDYYIKDFSELIK